MNRRAFLTRVAGAAAAVAVAPLLPAAPAAPPALTFHPDAFATVMDALPLVGETLHVRLPQRFDTLYGCKVLAPAQSCRIVDA